MLEQRPHVDSGPALKRAFSHRAAFYVFMIQDYRLGAVLLGLMLSVIALPYLFRASPGSRREWRWVVMAVVFLFWLLAGQQVLRAEEGFKHASSSSAAAPADNFRTPGRQG